MGSLSDVPGFDLSDFSGTRSGERSGEIASAAADEQLGELKRQFDIGQGRIRPFFEEAVPAFQIQSALAGAQGQEAQGEAFQEFSESPGQQFLREQGLKLTPDIEGERGRELSRFNRGLATQDFPSSFDRLGTVSGAGQQAAGQLAGLGQRFAGRTGDVLGQLGAGQQAALAAQQQAKQSVVGTGLGLLGAAVASAEHKKTDIRDMTNEECFEAVIATPIKAWKYLESVGIDTEQHIGPMFNEAPSCITMPDKEALSLHDELWLIAGALKYHHEVNNG